MTYLELLQLVKEGKQPKFIKVLRVPYRWDDDEETYVDRYDYLLSDYLSDCGTKALVVGDWIEVIEQ